MNTSEAINEIATALSKAQGQIQGAIKDSTNPHYKASYADLASIWDACRKPLSGNGLSVVQMTSVSEKDEVVLITRILHASGQWIEGTLALPVSKADAQGYGSALTYARRYGLAAAVGIAQVDDDGNLAAAAKPLPRPITATDSAREAFQGMSPEEQDFIRTHAAEIQKLYPLGDMFGYIEENKFDNEEKLALWILLPSDVRTAIKKQQAAARAVTA